MHNVYGDLYSMLTFGGTTKRVSRGARNECRFRRAEMTDLPVAESIIAGKPSNRIRVWVGRLVLLPLALATGTVAISSAIGEAAAKLYVDPYARKENVRDEAGDRY